MNLTLSNVTPTRSGHTFLGWSTSSTGGVVYNAGGTYSTNANVTLYAVWRVSTTLIYQNGTQYVTLSTDYSSGWNQTNARIFFGPSSINILMDSDYTGISLGTSSPINISDYSYFKATGYAAGGGAYTISVDISSLKGTYYLAFGIIRYDGTIRHMLSVASSKTNVFGAPVKNAEIDSKITTNMGYYSKVWLE